MEREVSFAVKLIIEMFVAAMIITIVVPMCVLSYKAYGIKLQDDGHRIKMETMAELYNYNNKQVSYYDAMELIMTHTRTYDYIFTSGTGGVGSTVILNTEAEQQYGMDNDVNSLEFWDYSNILEMTDAYSDAPLTATLITSVDGEQILGVRFTIGG